MKTIRKGILIQARMSSTRLPGKMLQQLGNVSLVEFVYRRCRTSAQADEVAVVTSTDSSDDELVQHCQERGMRVLRGPLNDVRQRYLNAANALDLDLLGRVCGDSPFVDVEGLDALFEVMEREGGDYMRTCGCLNGFISEVFHRDALLRASKHFNDPDCLEHVTTSFRVRPDLFTVMDVHLDLLPDACRDVTLTIDIDDDLTLARTLVQHGLDGFDFSSQDVLTILQQCK